MDMTTFLYQLFWCCGRNIPDLEVNTMSADALAPKDARASAGIVFPVLDS